MRDSGLIERREGPLMFLINFPLMLVPLAVYNFFLLAALNPWETVILRMDLLDASFSLTSGEGLILVSLLLLLGEMTKAAHNPAPGKERLFSFLVVMAFAAEFLLVPRATTSTFFLIGVIALIGLIGGFLVAPRHHAGDIILDPHGVSD